MRVYYKHPVDSFTGNVQGIQFAQGKSVFSYDKTDTARADVLIGIGCTVEEDKSTQKPQEKEKKDTKK